MTHSAEQHRKKHEAREESMKHMKHNVVGHEAGMRDHPKEMEMDKMNEIDNSGAVGGGV